MGHANLNQGLLDFLQASPTPFHAVRQMIEQLTANGYVFVDESATWSLSPGGKYFTTRNDSSIIAFKLGYKELETSGLRMIGAHTDSPCLKVKPNPEITQNGFLQLGVEIYGGALLNPWFDRDLSLAGRVNYVNEEGDLASGLVNFERAIAVVPSLAIHLDREANKNRTLNPQTDMPPLLGVAVDSQTFDFRQLLQQRCIEQGIPAARVLDFDMYFYDSQPPDIIGLQEEFIASARLDNLLSCYVGLQALLDSSDEESVLLVCNDHEEVGSASAPGAAGYMLQSVLKRLVIDEESYARAMAKSLMISVDNAHGLHPNFKHKHDENHGPMLNAGPVIKINAKQRYATSSETCARFRLICEEAGVPVQQFVVRSDMGCGSTIGPITSAKLGVATLDIGVPTFAMHSTRELAGAIDTDYLVRALSCFCEQQSVTVSVSD